MSIDRQEIEQKGIYENDLYQLDSFPGGVLPEDIIVTNEAKVFFERATLKDPIALQKQGLIGVAFLGDSGKTLYLDLMPAYNKDDGLEKKDKHGIEYKEGESVYTNEPMGGNSGRNHEQFVRIIEARIKRAMEEKNSDELKKYEGCYTIVNGDPILDRTKAFGYGVFKGDEFILLDEVRGNSVNINFHSVTYNREFLLINYFSEKIHEKFQAEYFIKRSLPYPVMLLLREALIDQLPKERSATQSVIQRKMATPHATLFDQWDKIKNNPEEKIKGLLKSLCVFIYREERSSTEEIMEIIRLIENNIEKLEPNKKKQNEMFSYYLNLPQTVQDSYYESSSIHPLLAAIKNKKNYIFDELIKRMVDIDFLPFIIEAIKTNNEDALRILIKKSSDLPDQKNEELSAVALKEYFFDNTDLLNKILCWAVLHKDIDVLKNLMKYVSDDVDDYSDDDFEHYFHLWIVELIKREKYDSVVASLNSSQRVFLLFKHDYSVSVNSAGKIKENFIQAVQDGDIGKLEKIYDAFYNKLTIDGFDIRKTSLDWLNAKNDEGLTMVELGISSGNTDVVKWLLEKNNDVISVYSSVKALLEKNELKEAAHVLIEIKDINLREKIVAFDQSIEELLYRALNRYFDEEKEMVAHNAAYGLFFPLVQARRIVSLPIPPAPTFSPPPLPTSEASMASKAGFFSESSSSISSPEVVKSENLKSKSS